MVDERLCSDYFEAVHAWDAVGKVYPSLERCWY